MSEQPNTPVRSTRSAVMVEVNGAQFPVKFEPRCRTCRSEYREWIEKQLLLGRSYASIARELEGLPSEEDTPHPSWQNISSHVQNDHLPLPIATQRKIVERRAQEIGRSIETYSESLADYVTAARTVVNKGYEAIVEGRLEPDISDVMAASRFLHTVDQTAQEQVDESAWLDSTMVFFEAAQNYVPQEMWESFRREIAENPILRAIAARKNEEEIVEGEVVEDSTDG